MGPEEILQKQDTDNTPSAKTQMVENAYMYLICI